MKDTLNQSRITVLPWSGRIPHPRGLKPLHFQPSGARFMLERNVSYLAADAGTGKTIMAALTINALKRPAVYFCPPFLALNTKYELEKWNTWGARIAIYGACDRLGHHLNECDILIVPDSMIADPLGVRLDLWNAVEKIGSKSLATAFIDEAHRYKTLDAQRTETLTGPFGLLKGFDRIAFMSGTPIPNGKPIELYPILSRFAPETIEHRSYRSFGMRYCAGFLEHTYADRSAYNFEGRSNVGELFTRMREQFMLRIRKRDVLTELKPRTTEMVILAEDLPPQTAALDRKLIKHHSPEDLMRKKIAPDSPEATYLRLLGQAKARLAVPLIKDILDGTDESALVFARHKDVVSYLAKGLAKYNPLVITGSVPTDRRQGLVSQFQRDARHRVFVLNQDAGGVGLTLTKANLVFQVEPSWVPGVNDQAADRADRIGQKRIVHERYLVFKNSMDRAIIESNITKRSTTDQL